MKYHSIIKGLYLTSILLANLVMAANVSAKTNSIEPKFAQLGKETGVNLGISAIDMANNHIIAYQAEKRFPIQSTFKLVLVSAILKESMAHPDLLNQKMTYSKQDLVVWSPITEKHVEEGMTISELCAATIRYSDNAAANLLMKKLGGPKAVTQFARSIGDKSFRVDNWEDNLNSNPKDIHDSSTPGAMTQTLQKILLGHVLAPHQREQLFAWMKGNTTGDTRIRAGVPKGWIVADKTGTGDYGISNDIGLIFPPNGAPIVVAIYSNQNKKDAVRRDEVVASAAKMIVDDFSKPIS